MPVPVETPIREDFSHARGQFTNYDAHGDQPRVDVARQKHVDIRTFDNDGVEVDRPILFLNATTMGELSSQTVGELSAGNSIYAGEQWTVGTVGRMADRNNWYGLSLSCSVGTTVTESVIRPPQNAGIMAQAGVLTLDLLTDFSDDSEISIALPAFPLASINLANSFVDFTSHPSGDFSIGPTVSISLAESTIPLVSGDSELRFPRSLLDIVDENQETIDQSVGEVPDDFHAIYLDRVSGVRFRITATAPCTFRAAAIRLLDPDWQYGKVDIDTRRNTLRPTVAPNGSITRPYDFSFPAVFRSTDPPGKDDPRPIDATVEVAFNTGSLAAAFTSTNLNSFTVYLREAAQDAVTQVDLNGMTMAELSGNPLPSSSALLWEGRPLSSLNVMTMGELEGTAMVDLNRQVDTNLANWQAFTVAWTTSGFASIKDGDDNGYDFGPFTIEPRTDYLATFSLESYTGRIVIHKLDRDGTPVKPPIFDSNLIIDDYLFHRRKGRIGWSTNFLDGDASVNHLRVRDLNYAEYRSAPFESLTPVAGAQLVVAGSEPIALQTGWESGPFGGVLRTDSLKSQTGKAIRIESEGEGFAVQGLWSNWLNFTNINSAEVVFDLWYPSSAKNHPLAAAFFDENARMVHVALGRITYDQWHRIKILPGLIENMPLGRYRFALLQPSSDNITWWVDNYSVTERAIDWFARPNQSDAFHDYRVDWVPLRHLVNVSDGGVLFEERGRRLQVQGLARRQNTQIGRIQVIPRYAELGRFVWEEERLVDTHPPVAEFSNTINGRTLFVHGGESHDPQGPIVGYEWNFGDGTQAWGQTAEHTYTGPSSTYTVSLTVTNKHGFKAQTSSLVAI